MSRKTIVVTGATGNVGRHLVPLLRETGVEVRPLSRTTSGIDLLDPTTLDGAFEGADAVFLVWPTTTADGAEPVVELIARHASRVVFLSVLGAETLFHGEIEDLIEATDVEWTFLRAGGFAANTLGWAEEIRTTGTVSWIAGDGGRSLIHEADIAAVAARTLTEEGHAGRRYDLTGPTVVTQREQVRLIGEAIGRNLRWVELSEVDARRVLQDMGWSQDFIEGGLAHWTSLVTNPEPVTDTVEKITGTPARTFAQWTHDHADAFR